MYTYTEVTNDFGKITKIIIRQDGLCIPADINNADYAAYLKWIDEGNTPLSSEPADPVSEPTPLTPQEKLANAGLSVEELKTLLGLK